MIPIGKSPAVNGSQAIHHPHMYVSFLGGIETIKPVVYCFTNIKHYIIIIGVQSLAIRYIQCMFMVYDLVGGFNHL